MLGRIEQERAELEAVLAAGVFRKAPALERFLTWICEKHFAGQDEEIKEYTIAVDALGRAPTFDPESDAIVRVEAHRLRRRLNEFYQGEGTKHRLQISIPLGRYAPEFSAVGVVSGKSPARWRFSRTFVVCWLAALMAVIAISVHFARARVANPIVFKEGEVIRILVGSSEERFVDRLGNVWGPDRYFEGGQVVKVAPRAISLASDRRIFLNRREGAFFYKIPLKPGDYELRLHFAETEFGEEGPAGGGEGSRVFSVFANNKPLLSGLDVAAAAGGGNTSDTRVIRHISPGPDGVLRLRFIGWRKMKAIVSAIEVLPASHGSAPPLLMVAGDAQYIDNQGRLWRPDHHVRGGQVVRRTESVMGADDPGIYRAERYGRFQYVIPLGAGVFRVRLRFTETWVQGPGKRIFDVQCNGQTLVKNLDVFQEAGGRYRALDKEFSGLRPDAQGKLTLSFVPSVNHAMVNAVEVIEEVK